MTEREKLLAAGWTVLRSNGYADASVAAILAEAGLGTRAFYRHFESKDQLLVEMFVTNARVTEERLAAEVASYDDPLDAVRAWIEAMLGLGYDRRHAEMAKMFASPVFEDAGEAVLERLRAPLFAALSAGRRSGAFPDCDPIADATTIHAIVWARFVDAMSGAPALSRRAAQRHVERYVLPALTGDERPNTSMS